MRAWPIERIEIGHDVAANPVVANELIDALLPRFEIQVADFRMAIAFAALSFVVWLYSNGM
jgi:hypothetical protein